jgi:hypothetical protein
MKLFGLQPNVPGHMLQVTSGSKDWLWPRYSTNCGLAAEWVSGLIFNNKARLSGIHYLSNDKSIWPATQAASLDAAGNTGTENPGCGPGI